MTYNDIIEIINIESREFQKRITLKPERILENNKLRYKQLCLKLARCINNKIRQPWLSIEELEKIYGGSITESKTSRGNAYYETSNKTRIYSSIIHDECFFDEDKNIYIPIKLLYTGNINQFYNTDFIIKLSIVQCLVLLKLINHDFVFNINENRIKNDNEIKCLLNNKVIIDAYKQYDSNEMEEEYFEL